MMCAIFKLLPALVLSIALPVSSPAEPNAPFMKNVALAATPPYAKHDYKWRQREYIYGPDYVDEFVGILDEQRALVFLLQDGNYNVTAVVNSLGALLEQYQYEPYGKVVRRTPLGGLAQPFVLRVGHQGLFFDRFDYVPGTPPLEAGEIDGVYYNRNRHYSPELGRFLQSDVNATGMQLLAVMAFHGQALDALFDEFDGLMQYVDGMNLYLYLLANPITGLDPSGLASLGQLLGGAAGSAALFAGQALSSSAAKGAIAGLFAAIMYNEAMLFVEMGEVEYLGRLANDAAMASTLPGGANMAQLMILRIHRIASAKVGPSARIILPAGIPKSKIAGMWPAARTRDGKRIYCKTHHGAALEEASEGKGNIGVTTGNVYLDKDGKLISAEWHRTW